MTSGEVPFLPHSAGSGLNTEWKCPETDCTHVELGKFDFPLGDGVCREHPTRRLVRYRLHG